jgi:hypothetical protein
MQEDIKTPLILGRPFLSTTNVHIDVGAGEIKFNINGKEERFEVSREASIKVSIFETAGYTQRLNPNGEVWFGRLKILNPRREVTR